MYPEAMSEAECIDLKYNEEKHNKRERAGSVTLRCSPGSDSGEDGR